MNLLNEIRGGFANVAPGAMLSLNSLEAPYGAWVFRDGLVFGVALDVPCETIISERFAGASLLTVDREFGGKAHHLLRLESSREALRHEFAAVCAQLLDPGENGEIRKALMTDPIAWWGSWRQLLGNSVRERNAYSVLGELLAFERLRAKGIYVDWLGPLSGSVDLEAAEAGYEVKSTVSRYESVVHVSGQFQLLPIKDRKLFLVHQRFEPSIAGVSIQIVVDRLSATGILREWLESLLNRCGLEEGCAARSEKFKLLESRIFVVDDNFPRITAASFVGGSVPPGIVNVDYQIDLVGLQSREF
ncbi:MAG: hypothetical protein JWQ01_4729 [Massilia sp.]|nr:hypothetical protein [Massilia sp.]